MPEWSNGPDSKSGVGLVPTVGSNPTLSAVRIRRLKESRRRVFRNLSYKAARVALCRLRPRLLLRGSGVDSNGHGAGGIQDDARRAI